MRDARNSTNKEHEPSTNTKTPKKKPYITNKQLPIDRRPPPAAAMLVAVVVLVVPVVLVLVFVLVLST